MSKQIIAGGVAIGGGAPVTIQSMCNTHTEDAEATIAQIHALEAAGCEIVRVTVPTMEAAHALSKIKENISIPLVADIHFDYRLAVEAAERGADKIRINPGNIGGEDLVKAVVDACRKHKVPIRIGVNGGSLEKELLAKYGRVTPEALVESALGHVRLLEKFDFTDICLSVKSSDVPLNMAAYRLLSERTDYPLHLGVTEAGTPSMGLVKSAMGIGGLLCLGIGDTIRVTLTADPIEEIFAAKKILKATGLRKEGVNLIACPTCGRTRIDLIPMAEDVERLQMIANRFSKIGSVPELEEADLKALLERVTDYIAHRTSDKVKIITHLPDLLPPVRLNVALFEWVIENLCKNAIDAMGGVGTLTISVQETSRFWHIDVADTGKGIDKRNFETVFAPGYTTKKRGWGLGLSLARRIVVEYHSGRIFVKQSEINKGTIFRIKLKK